MSKIVLEPHLTTDELFKRYRACTKANEKVRWRALYMISSGISAADATRRVGRTSGWATQLTQRYNRGGAATVADHRQSGRKVGRAATVTLDLGLELEAALQGVAPDGGLWTAKKVAAWIAGRTGRKLHETRLGGECYVHWASRCKRCAPCITKARARKNKPSSKKTRGDRHSSQGRISRPDG